MHGASSDCPPQPASRANQHEADQRAHRCGSDHGGWKVNATRSGDVDRRIVAGCAAEGFAYIGSTIRRPPAPGKVLQRRALRGLVAVARHGVHIRPLRLQLAARGGDQHEAAPAGVGVDQRADELLQRAGQNLRVLVREDGLEAGRADRRRGELDAHRVALQVGQVAGPGVVRVAGQHHQVLVEAARGAEHRLARHGVAVPGVEVVGDARLRQDRLLLRRQRGGVGLRLGARSCGVTPRPG